MGQPYVYRKPLIKRNDYTVEEIEKKYSEHELSQLVLFDNIFYYPQKIYHPGKLCSECRNDTITKEFQLSENKECLKCYEIAKKENYDYIMKYIAEGNIKFEGDCILENKLYLGGIESSFLKEELKKMGITHILMVGYFMTPLFPEDFTYENIEVNDNKNENILRYFIKAIKFIEQSKICYTHCQLGKSRSAAFAIAYVMFKNKIHFSPAFNLVRSKRLVAFPNEGFQCQLEDLDIILNNYDYDLDKCDNFIKKYLENKEKLKNTEKEYLKKRKKEKMVFGNDNYGCERILFSDNDDDDDDGNDDKNFDEKKVDNIKNDVEEKEVEIKAVEANKNEENERNENLVKNETEDGPKLEEKNNEVISEENDADEKKIEESNE